MKLIVLLLIFLFISTGAYFSGRTIWMIPDNTNPTINHVNDTIPELKIKVKH